MPMEGCFEYLGCNKRDCIMNTAGITTPCWQVESTDCNHSGIAHARRIMGGNKEAACAMSGCIYYKMRKPCETLLNLGGDS